MFVDGSLFLAKDNNHSLSPLYLKYIYTYISLRMHRCMRTSMYSTLFENKKKAKQNREKGWKRTVAWRGALPLRQLGKRAEIHQNYTRRTDRFRSPRPLIPSRSTLKSSV